MNTLTLRRKARRFYDNPDVPAHTNRHNQRAWVRSVLMLGDRWHLATTHRLVKKVW